MSILQQIEQEQTAEKKRIFAESHRINHALERDAAQRHFDDTSAWHDALIVAKEHIEKRLAEFDSWTPPAPQDGGWFGLPEQFHDISHMRTVRREDLSTIRQVFVDALDDCERGPSPASEGFHLVVSTLQAQGISINLPPGAPLGFGPRRFGLTRTREILSECERRISELKG